MSDIAIYPSDVVASEGTVFEGVLEFGQSSPEGDRAGSEISVLAVRAPINQLH